MKRATFPALMFVLLLGSGTAAAYETPLRFKRGEWDLTAGATYFGTNANYTTSGTSGLLSGNSYRLIDVPVSTRYTLSPGWAFFGEARIGNAESNGFDASRTNSSLTSSTLGVQMNTLIGGLEVIPEFSMVLPFEKVSDTQDAVMNNEGVNETRLRLRFQSVFDMFTFYGLIGMDLRGGGRSNLLPYSVGAEFNSAGTFHFGARLFGYKSTSDDTDANSTTREAARASTSLRVNGGSLKFYGINPSLVDTEAYGVYRIGKNILIGAAAGFTLSGANAAQGFHVDGSLTYRFSVENARRRRGGTPGLSIDPTIDRFEEDTEDGVDQKIFRPEPKKKPKAPVSSPSESETQTQLEFDQSAPAPELDTTPAPPPRPRPKPKPNPRQMEKDPFLDSGDAAPAHGDDPMFRDRKAPEPLPQDEEANQKKLQKQLDDAEMTIELKVDKKRKRKK